MIPGIASARALAFSISAVALFAACGDGGTEPAPGPALELRTEGRLERGATINVLVFKDGAPVPPGGFTTSASPSNAVTFIDATTVTLLVAGPVTLTALVASASGAAATKSITVAVPPTVVFEGLVNANRDIYRVSLDGGELLRLTTDPADDRYPTAVANRIVFVSHRDGNGELYALSLAGGIAQRLTTTPENENEPSLSSNGAKLAYTRFSTAGLPKLWTAAGDGSGEAELADAGNASSIEATPSWAPAGDRIAFLSTAGGLGNLYGYTIGAGAVAALPVGSPPNVEPAWSPDGKYVAFASDRDGDTEIYVVELATSAITRLTTRPGVDGQPSWLPDGRLLYAAEIDGVSHLRWLDPADPATVHDIPTGPGAALHPTAAR